MKKNPLTKGVPSDNSAGIGPVTDDLTQAKREPAVEPDLDRQDAILEALPETKRWDPVPGSEGQQAPESPSEDEDDEGRSETEQLVDGGAEEADRNRMLEAARLARKNE